MIGSSVKAKALVFAIFFLGIATGVLVANFYTTRVVSAPAPPNAPENAQRAQRDINKFYDYLGLDQPQREQMHKIGEETRREFQQLRQETQPRFKAIQEATRTKMRTVLNTDEQRKKYDDWRQRMNERQRNRERDLNKNSNNNNKEHNSDSEHGPKSN
jgi:Spy/CpxP family protein refolding chaperone